jgi:superfamily II DNA or RNA helicase/HKD family nuclease
MKSKITPGIYDNLLNQSLATLVRELNPNQYRPEYTDLDAEAVPRRVAHLIKGWIESVLESVPSEERHTVGIQLTRQVLEVLDLRMNTSLINAEVLETPLQRLTAIHHLSPDGKVIQIEKPLTPLLETVLLTNTRGEPAVGREIQSEIASADHIDLLCAFIRWTGIRGILPALESFLAAGRALRVLTTTYTGSTELRALQALVDIGAQVKVSYDINTTRLHAKAWMFYRDNGHSTVYIGSSNLTHSAQVTGKEWNVRASQHMNPELVQKYEATFDTYWESDHFEYFCPVKFKQATEIKNDELGFFTGIDVHPYPFQRQILEKLKLDRSRGFYKNLVVAATGTGKTIISAFDYQNVASELSRPRLLFIAHRKEILEQSLRTFRFVLKEPSFGELLVDGKRPSMWEHVFASIQSFASETLSSLPPDFFDVVIVDEFHHAAASSYVRVLDYLKPKYMLGLTATPERADGMDIRHWFGGRVSSELRLWDALEQELLVPFAYYGIHDNTDLSGVKWQRGTGYDIGELTSMYTGNDLWVNMVLNEVYRKIGDVHSMRALGFCVSVEHADFMAQAFNHHGIQALSVTSKTLADERHRAVSSLANGELQVLFTVDLFNEGVDIPSVDTVFMMRPTESATIFLQQLGRGLRHATGKSILTVLDFIGLHNVQFRFDLKLRAMLGCSRSELETHVDNNFPYLPSGCSLDLDRVSREVVLQNLRNALPLRADKKVAELRLLGDVTLKEFLEKTGLEPDDIYQGQNYWSKIRRLAGFTDRSANEEFEGRIGRGCGRMLHFDDDERIGIIRELANPEGVTELLGGSLYRTRQLQMLLAVLLSPKKGEFQSLQEAVNKIHRCDALMGELLQLAEVLHDRVKHLPIILSGSGNVPLKVHAQYSRDEILAAYGKTSIESPANMREGVCWVLSENTDLLFVTLEKSESDFKASNRYRDYAINETLFHWESQSTTTTGSKTGQRYLNHQKLGTSVVLFVRQSKKDSSGKTMPYFFAGPATYLRHESEQPISITWKLEHPLPGDLFISYRTAIA